MLFVIAIFRRSMPRDYPQTWNQPAAINYKPTAKSTMLQTGTYPTPQTSYQLPAQQQFYMGHFPYHTPAVKRESFLSESSSIEIMFSSTQSSPRLVLGPTLPTNLIRPIQQLVSSPPRPPINHLVSSLDYVPTYPAQQQYHSNTKHGDFLFLKKFHDHSLSSVLV